MPSLRAWRRHVALGALLLLTAFVFARAVTFGFITYDDPVHITQNPLVRSGLTGGGIVRAWLEVGAANLWHPLTWISHMADTTLFGVDAPAGPHAVNIAWHLVGTTFLFLLLRSWVPHLWMAVLLTALWSVHPLRVQSVVWLSERKDVLCGAFLFISWYAWERSRTSTGWRWWWVCLLGFFGAVLSKPAALPLPGIFLVTEVCRRLPLAGSSVANETRLSWKMILLRLSPLGLVAIAIAALAIYFQRAGALWEVSTVLTGSRRAALMPLSLWWYGERFFVPFPDLLWVYPPEGMAYRWRLIVATMGLLVAGGLLWRARHRHWLVLAGAAAVILLWLPVSGVVPVSFYYVADRYSYFSHIGLIICLAGVLQGRERWIRPAVFATAVIAFLLFPVLTWKRQDRWKTGEALFSAEMTRNPQSLLAPIHLGQTYISQGQPARALPLFRQAMEIDSSSGMAAFMAGQTSEMLGNTNEARNFYQQATARKLPNGKAWSRYAALSPTNSAAIILHAGIAQFPRNAMLHAQLGALYQNERQPAAAHQSYSEALKLDANCAPALQGLAGLLLENSELEPASRARAIDLLERLQDSRPDDRTVKELLQQLRATPQ